MKIYWFLAEFRLFVVLLDQHYYDDEGRTSTRGFRL